MTSSPKNIVGIQQAAEKKVLSKAQKLFNNLIKKIDSEKKQLLAWQEFIPQFQRKLVGEYDVNLDAFNAVRVEMVYVLDGLYQDKIFKKADKQKISFLICEISAELIGEHGKDDLKQIHDKYSDYQYDDVKQDADELASGFIKSMMQDMYGVDLGDDFDISSPEKYESAIKNLQDKQDSENQQQAEGQNQRKKTKKELEKEEKQQQEEQNISQSIREVYRKLTSALHPDRERDPVERERKTEIMQQVNAAYAKKDLLRLLELQLQVEQIDQAHLNNIADDRLKSFNKILKEQLEELQMEIEQLQYPFKMQLGLPPFASLTPKFVLQRLQHDIRDLENDIVDAKRELSIFQKSATLKSWLKSFKIPKEPKFDDFDDLFLDGFDKPY